MSFMKETNFILPMPIMRHENLASTCPSLERRTFLCQTRLHPNNEAYCSCALHPKCHKCHRNAIKLASSNESLRNGVKMYRPWPLAIAVGLRPTGWGGFLRFWRRETAVIVHFIILPTAWNEKGKLW